MTASPRVVLTAATAAQASVSLVGFGLPSIGPAIRSEFEIGLTALGAVLTASLIGSGLFLFAVGVAVDRYGSRRMMLIGTAVGASGLTAAAFAPSAPVLIAFMFVTGAGTSIVPIAGIGAVFRSFPVTRRAWALGIRQTGVPLGGVTAAVILPTLAHTSGVRAAFLFAAGALAVFGTAFAFLTGEEPVTISSRPRPRPQLGRVLRLPGMGRLLLVSGLYVVVLQAVLAYSVPSARDAGLSAFAAGAMFFAFQITAGVARIIWGRIADLAGGSRRGRTLAETGWLASCGALAFAAALHGGTAVVIPAAIAFGFGALGWNALIYVSAGERAPIELAAQAVAVAGTLIFLLGAASAPPMGALADHAGWDVFWVVCAGFALGGSLVAIALGRAPEATSRTV